MKKALLIIDIQNDYFSGGKFPLWNTETTLANIEEAIHEAEAKDFLIIHIQHVANPDPDMAPFFNKGTEGVAIHPHILLAAPKAPVVIKEFADGFYKTELDEILAEANITDLILCGMMTQNCVTHTAISKAAEKYTVSILADCCTTVDEMIHKIALNALSIRTKVVKSFSEI